MTTCFAARAAAASAALALVLTGCSSGDDESGDKAPTPADAKAAATAVNLTAQDLPGYGTTAAADSGLDASAAFEGFFTCVGAEPATHVLEQPSEAFTKGKLPIGVVALSHVQVAASVEAAREEIAAFSSEKASACLGTAVKAIVAERAASTPGATTSEPVVTEKDGVTGTDASYAYDIAMSVSAFGLTIPVSLTVDGFLVDHTEVALLSLVSGQGTEGPDRAALLATLVERAEADAV